MLTPILRRYLSQLNDVRKHEHATPELSLRDALSVLLKESAEAMKCDVQFIGEAKATQFGRPDYIVTRRDRLAFAA